MSVYQECYQPIPVAANSTVTITKQSVGGFLCSIAGTITITRQDGVVLVNAHPVTAGTYVPLPFFLGEKGATFVAAGGAAGTLGV